MTDETKEPEAPAPPTLRDRIADRFGGKGKQKHAEECGEVGETGEHGDLGENAK
jgi:hypothetical protein